MPKMERICPSCGQVITGIWELCDPCWREDMHAKPEWKAWVRVAGLDWLET